MEPSFDLTGRTALVTGGGRGLGEAAAHGLAAHGARVAVLDLEPATAAAAADAITASGAVAIGVACDVTDREAVEETVAHVEAELGVVDVLVANAGIGVRAPAEEMSPAAWRRVLEVNLDGVWHANQAVGARLLAAGRPGSIINMASVAGLVGVTTGNANYSASKGGVIALTRCLAVEWATRGVRVNAIAPTHFRTPLVDDLVATDPSALDYFLGNIPLGRLGEPEEIAGPVVFLASGASSMVTGHVLTVDGGHTAR